MYRVKVPKSGYLVIISVLLMLILGCIFFDRPNQIIDRIKMGRKANTLSEMEFDDNELLEHIRSSLIPPSTQPYKLYDINNRKDPYNAYQKFRSWKYGVEVVKRCFTGVKNGFFVEAGALDGEYLSNTLKLEKEQDWTGLLVEPGREMFQEILKRHRKAWHANNCIATGPFPHEAVLASFMDKNLMNKGQSSLKESGTFEDRLNIGPVKYEIVQCYPIASILLALNVTKVDFFSLDVEDVEVAIIDNFPFNRIDVEVWFIEHHILSEPRHTAATEKTDPPFVEKFTSRGYNFYKMDDYLFIKKGSRYDTLFHTNKS